MSQEKDIFQELNKINKILKNIEDKVSCISDRMSELEFIIENSDEPSSEPESEYEDWDIEFYQELEDDEDEEDY